MPLPLFSTEASGFPPLRRIRDSGNLSQPFAAARQNGTCMPPLALFGAGSSANPPRAEETEKEGEDGKRKRLQGFPPPSGAYAIRGTFCNRLPLRGRTEHACHRLPCSERVHRRIHRGRKRPKKRVRTARGRGCKASRRPPAHMQFGEPFATVCRCAAERNMHATACPVRSGFIGEAIRPAGVAVLSCLEQARRHIRRTGGRGAYRPVGMPPQAGVI